MAVDNKHSLFAVVVGSTTLGGISQQNISLGTEVRGEPRSGELYTRQQAMVAQAPRAGFTTDHIAAGLNLCGGSGLSISDLANGLILHLQKMGKTGPLSGSVHRKYTLVDGVMVPTTLSVSHGGDATLGFDMAATYDGDNDPVQIADDQALPTQSTVVQTFTLGPITIGAVTIDNLKSLEINFGLQVVTEGADGDIHPTEVGVVAVQPIITLRGIDPEWLKAANIPLTGKATTHANTAIYLRKRTATGFVADATEEHIKFTADGLAYVDDAMSASGMDSAETSLILMPEYDGSNAPIVINTTSALP